MSRVPVRQRGEYAGEKEAGDKMEAEKRKLFYKPLKRRGIIFRGKKIHPPELNAWQRADCAEPGGGLCSQLTLARI
jgi:hypothetical protein